MKTPIENIGVLMSHNIINPMHVQDRKHSNPKFAELKQLRKSKQRNIINETSQLTFQVLKALLAPQGGGEPKNYWPHCATT